MHTQLKVCGLKTVEEIILVNKYSVDYIGFVFSKSKRRITAKHAKKITKYLRDGIKKVGVFVDEPIDFVNSTASLLDLDIVQLHGNETEDYMHQIKTPIWKAIKVNSVLSLKDLPTCNNITGFLFDNTIAGSGKSFDWNLLKNYKSNTLFILAGGINSENVLNAINTLKPDIIDVSSSLEVNGIKNENKLMELLRRIKNV